MLLYLNRKSINMQKKRFELCQIIFDRGKFIVSVSSEYLRRKTGWLVGLSRNARFLYDNRNFINIFMPIGAKAIISQMNFQ